MADISKIKLPNSSEYNIKDNRIPGVDTVPTSGSDNVVTSGGVYNALRVDNIKPLDSHTFSGVYATSETIDTLFPFFRVIPTNWDEPVIVRYRFEAYSPSYKGSYYGKYECRFSFFHSSLCAYCCTNNIGSTSYRPFYYHSLMLIAASTYQSMGHLVGINFYASGNSYSRNATISSYARTFDIEILETNNCTIEWFSTCATISSSTLSGYVAETTHKAISNYDGSSQGDKHTGDANTDTKVRQYQHGDNAAGTAGYYPLLARYDVTNKSGTYEANYARFHTGAILDTSTGGIEAASFKKTNGTSSQFLKADGSVDSNTYATTSQIPSAPGTLNTTATTAQSTSSSEALSGNVTLHKVSKTGTYNDLIGTPDLSGYQTKSNLVTSISSSSTDIQYPSAKCVYSFVPKASFFDNSNTTLYFFASNDDKAAFIADRTQIDKILFSVVMNFNEQRITLADSEDTTSVSFYDNSSAANLAVVYNIQQKNIFFDNWNDITGTINFTTLADTGSTGTYTTVNTQQLTDSGTITVNVRNNIQFGSNKIKFVGSLSNDSSVTNYIEYLVNVISEPYMVFADSNVESICATTWGDGVGITASRASTVTSTQFGTTFKDNTAITSFNELSYFTGLTSIPATAFYGCSSLESVTIPTTVTSFGDSAFNSTKLTGVVTIPSNVTTIGKSAFNNCTLMTDFIANGVTDIAYFARWFVGCPSLVRIVLPAIQTINYGAYIINDAAMTSFQEFDFGPNLTSVGNTIIGSRINGAHVIIRATTPPTLSGANPFYGSNLSAIYVPYSSDHSILEAYKTATNWSNFSSKFVELDVNGNIPT